jgi:hypothetical protein
MYTVYVSPVFKDHHGQQRMFKIPVEAWSTYSTRDTALLALMELGGIHAKPTPEFMKIRSKMMAAKRKIERKGWQSTVILAESITK